MSEQNNDHSELELLYNVSVSDIAFFKQQQWSVTNYCLLVLAALVGIAQLLKQSYLGQCERWFLAAMVAATTLIGLFFLNLFRHSIKVRRKRLKKVRKHFGEVFKSAWRAHKREDSVFHFLVFVQITAAILVSWLLLCRL